MVVVVEEEEREEEEKRERGVCSLGPYARRDRCMWLLRTLFPGGGLGGLLTGFAMRIFEVTPHDLIADGLAVGCHADPQKAATSRRRT